ncbi:chitosanase [Streptomyces sp. NPDC007901]|uniref:chitosanase n=1 Tax=Streptomyces sp. NPDC007901 TaxID=3364785 RepID=UPI0036E19059
MARGRGGGRDRAGRPGAQGHRDAAGETAPARTPFRAAWRKAARTAAFRRAQRHERDRVCFDPAVARARKDGLGTLGQFVYYDAMVMHGPGTDAVSRVETAQRVFLKAGNFDLDIPLK